MCAHARDGVDTTTSMFSGDDGDVGVDDGGGMMSLMFGVFYMCGCGT